MPKRKIPKSAITERELKRALNKAIRKSNSAGEWAAENNITPQAVSAFLTGKQKPGLQIPEALGYQPVTVYIPLDEDPGERPAPRRETSKPLSKVDHSKSPLEKKLKKRRRA